MDPTWEELKEPLLDALTSAFSEGNFRVMLRTRCGKNYDLIVVPTHTYPQRVFDVIEDAQRDGWLDCLAREAREENPGHDRLQEVTAAILEGIEADGTYFYQQRASGQQDNGDELNGGDGQGDGDVPSGNNDNNLPEPISGKPQFEFLPFVIINGILLATIVLLATPKLISILPSQTVFCASDPIVTFCLTIIIFLIAHALWRVISLGLNPKPNIQIGPVQIPIAALIDKSHPWKIPDGYILGGVLVTIVGVVLLGLTPLSPTNQQPAAPVLVNYTVLLPDSSPVPNNLLLGQSLELQRAQSATISAVTGVLKGLTCEWNPQGGAITMIDQTNGCTVTYVAPPNPGTYFIGVDVSSACSLRSFTSGLFVKVP